MMSQEEAARLIMLAGCLHDIAEETKDEKAASKISQVQNLIEMVVLMSGSSFVSIKTKHHV